MNLEKQVGTKKLCRPLKVGEIFKFLLEYNCFTIVLFLLYIKVNLPYVYIYPLFFGISSHLGHHIALSRVPCVIQQVLISYLFYTQQCIYINFNLPIHLLPLSPLGIHMFVLYICVCISVLQIGSSVPFFQIPHTCINIYLFFSDFILYDRLQVHSHLYK